MKKANIEQIQAANDAALLSIDIFKKCFNELFDCCESHFFESAPDAKIQLYKAIHDEVQITKTRVSAIFNELTTTELELNNVLRKATSELVAYIDQKDNEFYQMTAAAVGNINDYEFLKQIIE